MLIFRLPVVEKRAALIFRLPPRTTGDKYAAPGSEIPRKGLAVGPLMPIGVNEPELYLLVKPILSRFLMTSVGFAPFISTKTIKNNPALFFFVFSSFRV